MLGKHVNNQLTALAHGELTDSAAARVRDHLAECESCRRLLEQIEFSITALEALPTRSAPHSLWQRVESQIPASAVEARPDYGSRWQWAGVAAALVLGVAVGRAYFAESGRAPTAMPTGIGPTRNVSTAVRPAAWVVESIHGAPRVGSKEIRGKSRLASGQWLETDSKSTARVRIADIGRADVRPNSRLTLVSSAKNEHRMRLERGELHAKVTAPPRLFIVETPSATAVDLGCEYTLTARPDGSSLLKVKSGWVAMEIAAHASYVPATMACITRPNKMPGTPYRQDAPAALVEALRRYDFGGRGAADLAEVVTHARKVDALSLWHLIGRAASEQKRTVFNSLNKLIPAPKGVTFELAAAGDRDAMNAWKDSIELVLFPSQGFNFTDLAVNVMKMQQKGVKK